MGINTRGIPPGDGGDVQGFLLGVLGKYMDDTVARGVIRYALKRSKVGAAELERGAIPTRMLPHLHKGIEMFVDEESRKRTCRESLDCLVAEHARHFPAKEQGELSSHVVELTSEHDIVAARSKARTTAELMGFSKTDQIKIATSVSELARNAVRYAGGGRISIEAINGPDGIKLFCEDQGPGIRDLDLVLSGKYQSKTGLGLGILGCRRIMDDFQIESGPDGTRITAIKHRC